jgi:DMSO/TMAO reductase YedYZ molybdopterin-dependent catalytic subunit
MDDSRHDDEIERETARRTRRSFITGGLATVAAIGAWKRLKDAERLDGIAAPARRTLELNESIAQGSVGPARLAPTFDAADVMRVPRTNGMVGIDSPIDLAAWRLALTGLPGGGSRELTLDAVTSLPRVEMITELMCVEGWSMVVKWTGARFSDFVDRFVLAPGNGAARSWSTRLQALPPYVAMSTPDNGYYVGLDRESALHPQTLLCYAMNDVPLTAPHGAPLRLVMPVKYGYKNIKRIGAIRFTDERPDDFWGKRGYDWYAGL